MNAEDVLKIARLMEWRPSGIYNWTLPDGTLVVEPHKELAAADAILDRIAALGWMVTVYTGPHPGYPEPVCRCCIMRGPQDIVLGRVKAMADTRPLAICEAFMEAMRRWGNGNVM